MIRCLLVQVSRNRRGQAVREERLVAADELRIGRGTDCLLNLPDPRVRQRHAVLRRGVDGSLWIEAEGTQLRVDGTPTQRARLHAPSEIHLGPYRLGVEALGGDQDLVLSVELVQPLPDDRKRLRAEARTHLGQTWLSKRGLAWAGAGSILLVLLLWPVLAALSPTVREASEALPVHADAAWLPGELAAAHQGFGHDCASCHQTPFVPVRDQACRDCHNHLGGHAGAGQDGPMLRVPGAPDAPRCATCHRDHKGATGLVRTDPGICTDCHGLPGAGRTDGRLPAIHDFGRDHPPITVSEVNPGGGLRFPHDVHVAPAGLRGPEGIQRLGCGDCHVADDLGRGFEPVTYAGQCADCHRLDFEPAAPDRQVPHGDAQAVLTALREYYGNASLGEAAIEVATIDGLMRRPGGDAAAQREQARAWAERKARSVAEDLVQRRSCVVCHGPPGPATADAPWTIAPVALTRRWFDHARFDHAPHGQARCVDCHAATVSTTSSDLLLPDLANCQRCHGGSEPEEGRIISTCGRCHDFHGSPGHGDVPGAAPPPAVRP